MKRPLSDPSLYPGPGSAILLCVALLGWQMGFGAVVAGGAAICGYPPKHLAELVYDPWFLGPVNLLAFGFVLLWVVRRRAVAPAEFLRSGPFPPALVGPVLVATLGLAVVFSAVDNWIVAAFSLLPNFDPAKLELMRVTAAPFGSFLVLVLVAPVTEEVFFRGLLLRRLLRQLTVAQALWLTAGLFAIVHANLRQGVLAVVLGLIFGHWLRRTGSIGPALIGHAAFNFLAFASARWPDEAIWLGGWHPTLGLVHQSPVITLAGAVLAGLGFWWFEYFVRRTAWPQPVWAWPATVAEAEPPLLASAEPPLVTADAAPPTPVPSDTPPPAAADPQAPASPAS